MSPARSRTVRKPTPVENDAYGEMLRRCVKVLGHRIGRGDVEHVRIGLELVDELKAAIAVGVAELHAKGESWERIGRAAGMTRQAAQKRWGIGLMDASPADD